MQIYIIAIYYTTCTAGYNATALLARGLRIEIPAKQNKSMRILLLLVTTIELVQWHLFHMFDIRGLYLTRLVRSELLENVIVGVTLYHSPCVADVTVISIKTDTQFKHLIYTTTCIQLLTKRVVVCFWRFNKTQWSCKIWIWAIRNKFSTTLTNTL